MVHSLLSSIDPALPSRLKKWFADSSHRSLAQRVAGAAFLIRLAGAAVVFASQVLLARWMGSSEFGVFVYVWTWVLLLGDTVHLGLASAAQRLIPEYGRRPSLDRLRGFLVGSRRLVFAIACLVALAGAAGIRLGEPWIDRAELVPLYLACATLPFFALSNMLDGIARSYNWINLALVPPYLLRPLILVGLMAAMHAAGLTADATAAMTAAVIATWSTAIVQLAVLDRRLADAVAPGPKVYEAGSWLAVSLPILTVWGFYTLLTYTDVLVLRQFRPADEVAHYFAAGKILALVAFIYFAVSASVGHRFAEYDAAGDRERVAALMAAAVRWTFWPSLAATALALALGRPLLSLFGPEFVHAYPLMFVFAAGLMARAAVGPAERLLNMLGAQRLCAVVYAAAFVTNLLACLALIPRYGALGAAISTAVALTVESALLAWASRSRLGIAATLRRRPPAGKPAAEEPC